MRVDYVSNLGSEIESVARGTVVADHLAVRIKKKLCEVPWYHIAAAAFLSFATVLAVPLGVVGA